MGGIQGKTVGVGRKLGKAEGVEDSHSFAPDEWMERGREADEEAGPEGQGHPEMISC